MLLRKAGIAIVVSTALVLSFAPNAFALDPVTPTLARLTQTSSYSPPAPDPMGITYVPWTNHLLITDSEVEEIPSLFTGKNLFETSLDGTLLRTGTTIGWSNEPTDVSVDPATHRYFFSDDDGDQVVIVDDGANNLVGDGDDSRTAFSTRGFNGTDIEGVAFAGGDIYLLNGSTTTMYRINDGANNQFEGGGDDVITAFNIGTWQTDPEGIEYNPARGTLSVISNVRQSPITEFTLAGAFVDNIDVSTIDMRHASGITFGPGSANSSVTNAYVSDRGVDNDFDPSENDGKLYELAGFGVSTGNAAPVVTNPGTKTTFEGDPSSEQIVANDSDGPNALSYSATGLPPGLGINATTGLISGTITAGASFNSPYSVDVAVSDGLNTSHAVFPWNVLDHVPPAAPTGPITAGPSTTRALAFGWTANTEPDLAGYQVTRYTSSSFTTIASGPTSTTTPSFSDTGATAGADNFYRIVAVDRSGNPSQPLSATVHRGIAFKASSTKHQKTGSTITVNAPAGTTSGNLLVASVAARGGVTIGGSGWTLVKDQATGTNNMRVATLTRLSAGESSYTITLGASSPSTVVLSAYAGVASVASTTSSQAGTGSSITAPTVSPSSSAVIVGTFGIAASGQITQPNGMLENGEAKQTPGKNKVTVEQSDQVVPSGATGSKIAVANKSAANAGVLIVLLPL